MSTADSQSAGRYDDELGHVNPLELARLRAITTAFDPDTEQRLAALRVPQDGRCLEVGAGTGTTAVWLAARCSRGRVTATDLDLTLMPRDRPDNLDVVRHDVTVDEFPEHSFDLIHARFVLMHLPQREQVVERMRRWLVPGGTLHIEELVNFPCAGMPETSPLRRGIETAWSMLAASYGMERNWGTRAASVLTRCGYREVMAEASLPASHPGAPVAEVSRLSLTTLTPALVERGLLSEEEVEAGIAELLDPARISFPLAVIAVRGRR
ncbi:class I SAM-dependent methyltransferase [Streptomyces sp. NPDC096339]|uniref:class I SAM-dependent methyltransferase n=1 Tax=Streptomyces sp. NPDC096339 TaxID=3366086 RepID=UPI003805C901